MRADLLVGIIGLGKFGLSFGRALTRHGTDVVGLDSEPDNVRKAQGELTQVYQGDAMDRKVLEQLGFSDMTHIMVSVGQSIEASAMISLYLKEISRAQIWVKAVSTDHEKLLKRIGVDKVIFPEYFAANELANQLAMPGLLAYLSFEEGFAMRELEVDKWAGKSLIELDLTNKHHVQVVAVRSRGTEHFRFIPRPGDRLQEGDNLVLIGHESDLEQLKS